MKNFEKRRDRFEFFESFENPLLNLSFDFEVQDFRPFCKSNNLPPFHFFLYCLFSSLNEIDNFKYRIMDGKVFKVDELVGSYTILNEENNFNFTRFKLSPNLQEFIKLSLASKEEAMKASSLIHTGLELSPRDMKNYIFITSIPWLKITAIEHPTYKYKSADIPSIAWGKFTSVGTNHLSIPLSVQAHHGFVDAFHIHQLAETIKAKISSLI
jgi:chloramphenicol O-acetyltransferase type A